MARSLVVLTTLATGLLLAAGCGSDPAEPAAATGDDAGAADDGAGVRLVSVEDGVATLADPPADLVVLDRDYLDVAADDIKHITSLMTIVGGRIVYDGGL